MSKDRVVSALPTVEDMLAHHAQRDFGSTGFREVSLSVFTKHEPVVAYRIVHIWRVSRDLSCSSLYSIAEPAVLRGTAVKLVERPYVENLEVWLWLRTTQQPVRVDSSRSEQTVLGTDFAYSDLRFWLPTNAFDIYGSERRTTSDGDVYILKGWRMLGTTRDCELRLTLDATRWLPLTIERLDASGSPTHVYSARGLVSVDGVWTPRTISITRPREQYRSVMTLRRAVHGVPMEASLFRTEQLCQLSDGMFEKWITESHQLLEV